MKKVNVLLGTEVQKKNIFLSYWSILYENINNLKNENIEINFFFDLNDSFLDADIIILSSRFFFNKNVVNIDHILSVLKYLNKKNPNIIWFDLRDSAGTTQFEVLPYVKKYLKGQLYKNLKNYSQVMYGGRYYTNYYFLNNQIYDDNKYNMTLLDSNYFHKLGLSWNIGTLRYDLRFSNLYKLASHYKLFHKYLSRNDLNNYNNYNYLNKKYRVNALFNYNFERKSVGFQRLLAIKKIKNKNKIDLIDKKLSPKNYFNSITQSKVVLSLFGWGEICYRDWESLILGTPFIKPEMDYLETWPNIYIPNKTFYPVKLSLENLDEVIDFALSSEKRSLNMIKTGQNIIKSIRKNNCIIFCERFKDLITI